MAVFSLLSQLSEPSGSPPRTIVASTPADPEYTVAPYTLHPGDAEVVLQSLPSHAVHAALTSPPYWSQRHYDNHSGLGTEKSLDDYVARLVRIFRELKRVLRKDGSLWLNLGDTYRKKNLCGVPWRVVFALQGDGWILRNSIVWDKVKGNPCNAKDKLRNVHEYVFHLVQRDEYYYNVDAIRNPPRKPYHRNGKVVTPTGVSGSKYERQIRNSPHLNEQERINAFDALRRALLRVESGEMPDFRMIIRGQQRSTHSESPEFSGRASELQAHGFCILPYHKNGTKPGDVWHIIPEDEWRTDGHYAVFPLELCELPILATCPTGGILLDPFCGTGTALAAALELGKRAIGIDTSGAYLAEARSRLDGIWSRKQASDSQLSLGI